KGPVTRNDIVFLLERSPPERQAPAPVPSLWIGDTIHSRLAAVCVAGQRPLCIAYLHPATDGRRLRLTHPPRARGGTPQPKRQPACRPPRPRPGAGPPGKQRSARAVLAATDPRVVQDALRTLQDRVQAPRA